MSTSMLAPVTSATMPHGSIPHDCEPAGPEPEPQRRPDNRLIGIDAARGLALIGMVSVHTIAATNGDGDMSLAWVLASGKAAALFAVLGGVGLAFMSGRTRAPRGERWLRACISPLVRAVFLVVIGGLLGALVPADDAKVILPYLGLMFLLSTVLLPLRAPVLIGLGLAWAVVGPILSHVLRQTVTTQPPVNLSLTDIVTDPGRAVLTFLLTGFYPACTWMAYICVGLGVGRAALDSRRAAARLLAGGLSLVAASLLVSWSLINVFGAWNHLAAAEQGRLSLETFTESLVWGGEGTFPATSWWWLAVNAPHSATPMDLLYTIGIALTAIGAMLGVAHVFNGRLSLLSVPGSMTLTLYTMHLLLFSVYGELPDLAHFGLQIVTLTAFALVWSRYLRRGPLEWLLWRAAKAVTPARRTVYVPRRTA